MSRFSQFRLDELIVLRAIMRGYKPHTLPNGTHLHNVLSIEIDDEFGKRETPTQERST